MKCTTIAIAFALLVSAAPARPADPVGRFFFTPAQRAKLDTARSEHARGLATSEPAEATPPPKTVTYNGMVRRSDGKSTVWINRRPVQREDSTGVAVERVRPDGAVTLKVPQTNRDVQLKVGQTMNVVSGIIEEPFDRRRGTPKSEPGAVRPAGRIDAATANTNSMRQGAANASDAGIDADQKPAPKSPIGGTPRPPNTVHKD